MPWVKLEDSFFGHPKAIAAGPLARELNFAAWCWSASNLTDGCIPAHVVPYLAAHAGVKQALAGRLVEVGLWDVTEDGFLIHDYLHYQPTRVEVEEDRRKRHEAKVRAGQMGGIASGAARRKHNGTNGEAEVKQEGKQN